MLQPISTDEYERLRALARNRDPNALAELAETYRMGRVVGPESIEPDPKTAEQLWKMAARAGNPRARERRRIRRSLRQKDGVGKAFDAIQRWVRNIGIGVTLGITGGVLAYQSLVGYQSSEWPPIRVVEGLRWIGLDVKALADSAANGPHTVLASLLEVPLALVFLLLGLLLVSALLGMVRLLRPSRFD